MDFEKEARELHFPTIMWEAFSARERSLIIEFAELAFNAGEESMRERAAEYHREQHDILEKRLLQTDNWHRKGTIQGGIIIHAVSQSAIRSLPATDMQGDK